MANQPQNQFFLGKTISDTTAFTEPDEERLNAKRLPILKSVEDCAEFFNLSVEQLRIFCLDERVSKRDFYQRYSIKKRSGGNRIISAPTPQLSRIQTKINSQILSKLPVSDVAMAFRPGKSILDNAMAHRNAEILIRFDLKDFFPSITFKMVRNYLIDTGYSSGVSTVIALLVTDRPRKYIKKNGEVLSVAAGKRSLPQGAATSPALANALFFDHDISILAKVKKYGWRYTRYADDLVFSLVSPKKNDDPDVDKQELENRRIGFLLNTIYWHFERTPYKLNTAKTKIARNGTKITVTGLGIDGDRIFIQRNQLRKVRAFLFECEKIGIPRMSEKIGRSAIHVAQGYISYISMVDKNKASALVRKHPWLTLNIPE